MNPGPLRQGRFAAAPLGRRFLPRAYFTVGKVAEVPGPIPNVPAPLPGRDNVPEPLPGRSVPPPLPGRSVVAPVLGGGAASGLGAAGSLDDFGAESRLTGGMSWLAARLDAAIAVTKTAISTSFKERMGFSCKGVLENDLAGAHPPLASRRVAVLPGDDLPAAKAVMGEISRRSTDGRSPCQGSRTRKFRGAGIAAPNSRAAGPQSEDLHG
jgi:hypothetical protein